MSLSNLFGLLGSSARTPTNRLFASPADTLFSQAFNGSAAAGDGQVQSPVPLDASVPTAVQGPDQTPQVESHTGDMQGIASAIAQDPGTLAAIAASPRHAGRFGIHGVARDILGTIGDAFLIQSGNKPIYGPARDQEKAGDALAGLGDDPMAAIQNLAAVNPELAQKYFENYQNYKSQMFGHQVSQNAVDRQTAKDAFDKENAGRAMIGNILYAGRADPASFAQARTQALAYAQRNGIPTDGIPDTYDQAAIDKYSIGTVPVDKQIDNSEAAQRDAVNKIFREGLINNGVVRNRILTGESPAKIYRDVMAGDYSGAGATFTEEGTAHGEYRTGGKGAGSTTVGGQMGAGAASMGDADAGRPPVRHRPAPTRPNVTRPGSAPAPAAPTAAAGPYAQYEGQTLHQNGKTYKVIRGVPVLQK